MSRNSKVRDWQKVMGAGLIVTISGMAVLFIAAATDWAIAAYIGGGLIVAGGYLVTAGAIGVENAR